jgi:putative peptide zinc metalloprotease protein
MDELYSLSDFLELYPMEDGKLSVFHRQTKKSYILGVKEAKILPLFNGVNTAEAIHQQCRFFTEDEIAMLAQSFRELGFFQQYQPTIRFHPLKIRVAMFNPNKLLSNKTLIKLLSKMVFFASPAVFAAGILWVLLNRAGVCGHFLDLAQVTSYWSSFGIWDAVAILAMNFISLTVHEFAHAVTARSYDVNVPEMGVMLYLFIPTAYTNVSSMRLIKSKKAQLAILSAGCLSNLGMIGIAYFILYLIPDSQIGAYMLALILINAIIILLNGLVFVKYDAYYALEVILDEPGLQNHAFSYLGQCLISLLNPSKRSAVLQHLDAESKSLHLMYVTYAALCVAFIPLMISASILSLIC